MTLGWVVNGERRHAGQQGEWIPRGHGKGICVTPSLTLAQPGLRLNTFTLSCAESSIQREKQVEQRGDARADRNEHERASVIPTKQQISVTI
jgi:hypothetical protein